MNTPQERIAAIRHLMKAHDLMAWIIPSADPHLSEYLPRHWQARRWVSGFRGSAGTLVITSAHAGLWTDSRYWVQAEAQLAGTGITLHKLSAGNTHVSWLASHLPADSRVGVAPDMLSLSARLQLQQAFVPKNIRVVHERDLVAEVWADRPPLPSAPIYAHEARFVSERVDQKLSRVREAMQARGATWHLLSSLDDIAWLTNLRGADVSYNPVFLAHVLIGPDRATLFVDVQKLDARLRASLAEAGIRCEDYAQVTDAMARVNEPLLLDPAKVAVSTLARLPGKTTVIESTNPSTLFKALKSQADIAQVREAMVEDGIALCGFFAELEQCLAQGRPISELDVADRLLAHRQQRRHFVSPSFGTIAGFNANGALPHYSATPESFSQIEGDGLLLIDSGAQYLNGTTDITRVVPVGTPSAAQKRDFTRVLKAHIALAETVFPEGIAGPLLDAICRKPLWQAQLDFGHGTGHGIGYFLNVHEGPQVISCHSSIQPQGAMREGMITSIEPGLYRPGQWGIRIENLVVNQLLPPSSDIEVAPGPFMFFETLTLCPIDTRLVDPELMTQAELDWLNAYHARVRERLADRTEGAAHEWLMRRTEPI
ncbi:MAG: aminopeptidase P family protein [Lautropia sp.]|nr:aminopeptidase P family protein [Lautropia sp.]